MLALETGDEVAESMLSFSRENRIRAAAVSAIGAFRRAVLALYDAEAKDYAPIEISEQVEVLSLAGDIALDTDDEPRLHLHAVVAKRDGSAWGGHLMSAEVRPTLEVVLTESPQALHRRSDSDSGLALPDL